MDLRLENFVTAYPPQDDKNIIWKISRFKEFNELASTPDEKVPEPGKFFKHQYFVQRLLMVYDKCFVIHETGTGKSCTLVSVAEYYRENSNQIKAVYVLEKGETTKADFKNQVINRCTQGTYKRNRDVNEWYKVMTYGDFVTKEIGNLSESALIEKFSGCIFFVDEAHNLRNYDKVTYKNKGIEEQKFDDDKYNKIKNLFRIINRSKIIISTATPMINHPSEVGKLINLLNDEDVPEDFDWENGDLTVLEPFFRGKVSYVRSLDTGIDVIYEGDTERYLDQELREEENLVEYDYEPSPLYHLPMVEGGYQDNAHKLVYNDQSNVWQDPIRASTFVPPFSTDVDIAGPPDLAIENNGRYEWNNAKYHDFFDPEQRISGLTMEEYVSDWNRLNALSVKFAFIVANELSYRSNVPGSIFTDEDRQRIIDQGVPIDPTVKEKGNGFAYIETVKRSGAIYLGLTLEAYGFEKFNKKGKVISNAGKILIEKKLRYGMIVGQATDETKALMEVFNHPDNCNGEYVQLIVGSEIARDGINLYNVTRGYLVTMIWHVAGIYQAMSRFIRAVSQLVLVQQRDREIELGIKDPDLPDRIKVRVYYLSAVNSQNISTDDYIFVRSENKNFLNRRVLRFLKRVSVDCMVHYSRNVRDTDQDYSQQCDYDKCNYTCLTPAPPRHDPPVKGGMAKGQGPTPREYVYTNYNLLFQTERLALTKQYVIDLVDVLGSVTFDFIVQVLTTDENYLSELQIGSKDIANIKRYVYDTIDMMTSQKIVFYDNFGYENFIQTDGINIYSQREYPKGQTVYQETGFYSQSIVGNFSSDIESVTRNIFEESDLDQVLKDMVDDEQIINNFKELIPDQELRIKIFENSLKNILTDNPNTKPYQEALVNYYDERNMVYTFYEPVKSIKDVTNYMNNPGPGAPPKNKFNITIPPKLLEDIDQDESQQSVVLHIYHRTMEKGNYVKNNLFNPSSYSKDLRILKLNNKNPEWENLSPAEAKVYTKLIDEEYNRRIEEYKSKIAYAYIFDDDDKRFSLVIHNPDIKDKRQQSRGRDCGPLRKDALMGYLWYLSPENIDVSNLPQTGTGKVNLKELESLKEFIDKDLRSKSSEWIKKVYTIHKAFSISSRSKSELCNILKNAFILENRIIFFPVV